jgi:hypothetical protein
MAMEIPANERSHAGAHPAAGPYLAPVEKPKGLMLRLLYWFMRRQFGKTPSWLTVFGARMPLAFTNWGGRPTGSRRSSSSRTTPRRWSARASPASTCARGAWTPSGGS